MTALKKAILPVPKSAPDRPKDLIMLDAIFPPKNGAVKGRFAIIPRDKIEPNPFQPRKHFDQAEIRRLGDSMFDHGQVQPIAVRLHPKRPGWYQLIAGERRWQAAEPRADFNGLPLLQAMVYDIADDEMGNKEMGRIAFIENTQRTDLTPAEEVAFVLEMIDDGLSQMQINRTLNKDRNWAHDRVAASRVGQDLQWLLEYEETIDLAIEANKVTSPVLRGKMITWMRERTLSNVGVSKRLLKEWIEAHQSPKAAPRQTPQEQQSAWTTHNAPDETNAPDPSPSATAGHSAPNSGITVTHNREVAAQPAHSVQTTIEYSNETLVQGQNVARHFNAPEMLPEQMPANIARMDEMTMQLLQVAEKHQGKGVWAIEVRNEMQAAMQRIEAGIQTLHGLIEIQ